MTTGPVVQRDLDTLILYLEDDGFRSGPNLPTGPCLSTLYTYMHI